MTNLVDYTARFLDTAEAMDYSLDELDDLTSRKVEAVEVDGDALARIVRARRGSARYRGEIDPYLYITDAAAINLWATPAVYGDDGNRRMAAVGGVTASGTLYASSDAAGLY